MINQDRLSRDRKKKLLEKLSGQSDQEGTAVHEAKSAARTTSKKKDDTPGESDGNDVEGPPAQSVTFRRSPLRTVLLFLFVSVLSLLALYGLREFTELDTVADTGSAYVGPLPSEKTLSYRSPQIPQSAYRCDVFGEDPAEIDAVAYIAVRADTFEVLYEKNGSERAPFASIVKLLGALVIVDEYDLDSKIGLLETVDPEGNGLDLEVGEKASVENLLGAALIGSKNDAMYAIAQNHPDGVSGFVGAMRNKAEAIGLEDTSIKNVIGLDDMDQYSTPRDIAVLLIVTMRQPVLREILGSSQWVFSTENGRTEVISSTNLLLGGVPEVIGGKTGFTSGAGLSLTTYVAGEPDFVTVVLNAEDRYGESQELIDMVATNLVCK